MYNIKKIMVPTDFSHFSKNALLSAGLIAELQNTELVLLHVDEFDATPLGYFEKHDDDVQVFRDNTLQFLKSQLDLFAEESMQPDLNLCKKILPGRSYKVIIDEAESGNYDLIVIARRGMTNLSNQILGSTAERVVRLARCPVLSVTGNTPPQTDKIKQILCPTDFSLAGNAALGYAFAIAKRYGAKIYIQHVSDLPKEPDMQKLKEQLPDIEQQYPDYNDNFELEYIFDRDIEPNNSIIRFAKDREIDLIVMSTHGAKGLRRVFIGNNVAEVVRKAECPVLTVTHPIHKVVFTGLKSEVKEN